MRYHKLLRRKTTPDGPSGVVEQEDRFGCAIMEGGRTRREMEYYSHHDIAATQHHVEKQIARY